MRDFNNYLLDNYGVQIIDLSHNEFKEFYNDYIDELTQDAYSKYTTNCTC